MELLTPASQTVRSNFAAIFPGKSSPLIDLALVLTVEADKSVLKWADAGAPRCVAHVLVKLISDSGYAGLRKCSSGDSSPSHRRGVGEEPATVNSSTSTDVPSFRARSVPIPFRSFQY